MTAPGAKFARSRRLEVLISGTFDVGNYGDLLFPMLADYRLGRMGYHIVPMAPTGQTTVFADARPAISIADALDRATGYAGVLIGGGDIIHAWRAGFLREYRDRDVGMAAYPLVWFGASLIAALKDAPIAWNAPGAPGALPLEARQRLLGPALAVADYIAVRDAASARALPDEHAGTAAIVPDTAVDIARLWDKASLSDSFEEFLRRKSLTPDDALLCLHVRPGGWGKHTPASLAAAIERFAAARGMVPVLLSVAPSLGDRDTLRAVSRCLGCRHAVADDAVLLREIAAVIGGSRAYIGNSLHGYVTAAAYGVAGVIIARPGFAKFTGFAEQIGRAADVVRDWDAGLDRLAATLASGSAPRIEPALHRRLDWHWQAIAEVIARPEAGRARRAALLSYLRGAGDLLDALGPLKPAFAAGLRDSAASPGVTNVRRP